MSREWIAAFGFILIFVLVAWRVPIDIAMGIAGVLGFGMVVGAQPALNLFGNVLLSVLTDDNLSVIPLLVIFVLCGIMTETDVSKVSGQPRHLDFADCSGEDRVHFNSQVDTWTLLIRQHLQGADAGGTALGSRSGLSRHAGSRACRSPRSRSRMA